MFVCVLVSNDVPLLDWIVMFLGITYQVAKNVIKRIKTYWNMFCMFKMRKA